jgi:hypothetical protein
MIFFDTDFSVLRLTLISVFQECSQCLGQDQADNFFLKKVDC